MQQRWEESKQKFKNQIGLIVDKPNPVYGNTNDGNTARRFFMNRQFSGEITVLEVNLIKKFSILLWTLFSGYDINLIEFEKHCCETRILYLYSWHHYMSVTVHKIIVHSTDDTKTCILPIGQNDRHQIKRERNWIVSIICADKVFILTYPP